MADKIKMLIAIIVLAGSVWAFYYFGDQSTLLRVGGILVALAIATAVMLQTATGRNAWAFIQDSQTEIRKVVWPSGKETWQTTGIVMVMVVLIAIFLWFLDMFLIWAVKLLTGQGA
jgi:preprotein translocase subunit SecE